MHYVDEGPREAQNVILCLHGEPTWSFLYRKMIPVFVQAGYRVIAPDLIGFGKSDKFTHKDNYNYEMHASSLRHLLDHLNLTNITLVCQDWGGLIGLSLVADASNRFANLVIMNTGLPVGQYPDPDLNQPRQRFRLLTLYKGFTKSLNFLIFQSYARLMGHFMSNEFIFHWVCHFPSEVVEGYKAPFPNHEYKAGVAKFPLLVPLCADDISVPHMMNARKALRAWNRPALVMFGDKDRITKPQKEVFYKLLPHCKKVNIHGADHFLQETHGHEVAEHIVRFVNEVN